jgi:hypothetical protein
MIHIFGDSHANTNFTNLKYNNILNHYQNSITMHRVGRDKLNFINFINYNINNNDIIIYQFGEVDCRCHIARQLLLQREFEEIINELVNNYIDSIKLNKQKFNNLKIIISCIPPPINKEYYENIHGPVTHEFPFLGSNYDRCEYTKRVNNLLKTKCLENSFYFLDYYNFYTNNEGTLKTELSDNICHISHNEFVLNELYKIIDNL